MSGDHLESDSLKTIEKFFTKDGDIDTELFMSSDLDSNFQSQLMEYYTRSCAETAALQQELQQLNTQKLEMKDRVNSARTNAMNQVKQATELEKTLVELEEQSNVINEIVNAAENIGVVKVSCRRLRQQHKFYTHDSRSLHDRIVTKVEQEMAQNSLKPSHSSPNLTVQHTTDLEPEVKKTPSALNLSNNSDFGPALKVDFEAKSRGFDIHFSHDLDKVRREKKVARKEQKLSNNRRLTQTKENAECASNFDDTKIIFTTFCREPENVQTEPGQYSYFEIPVSDSQQKSKHRENIAGSDTVLATKFRKCGAGPLTETRKRPSPRRRN